MDMPVTEFPNDPATAQPVHIVRPIEQIAPLVIASAHSGREYLASFVAQTRLDPVSLRRSEDCFVDELFADAPSLGAPLLAARFPRAFCDVNRERWELDPAMFDGPLPSWVNTASARVGAGLGTIARVVATGETIYRRKLGFAEAQSRVREFWEPFHAALAELIGATRARFGSCVLIDAHSMPAASRPGPDFVLGDAHGTSCSPRLVSLVEAMLQSMGYSVRRNDPYAGGYITRHYGRPRDGVHALQVEISRPLYMDEARIGRLAGFDQVRRDVASLLGTLTTSLPEGL